jgi:hypothetical protein
MRGIWLSVLFALSLFMLGASASPLYAASREASFTDPGVSVTAGATSSEAVIVEPKNDIDTGETFVNVARRVTLFFINQSSAPVNVISVTTNSDGNVKTDIVSDDCTKGGKIASASRCAVVVESTPVSSGPWSAEVLLTHDGLGRIARVKLSGKTSGSASSDKKDTGLSLSTKDVKPVDFGEVVANSSKVVRSALMVNDSPETITLLSIDVIAADNGLERLDQGCAVDMELKPGESCPVTLLWKPTSKGLVSTDLILRHTGRLGFAVIPIRGNAKTDATEVAADAKSADSNGKGKSDADAKKPAADKVPLPTSAEELEKLATAKIPPLDESSLPAKATGSGSDRSANGSFHLIGTVGNRALLLKPDGTTVVAGIGEEISYGDGSTAKLMNVTPRMAELFINGKKKELPLEAAQELIAKASASASNASDKHDKGETKQKASGSSPSSSSSSSSSSSAFGGGRP